MGASALAQVLRPLHDTFGDAVPEELLVGLDGPDDAAVYRLDAERALVVTLDFFTPIVDDPYAYGAIAAANSLSDVYAMGAEPILALNVAALPSGLPIEIAQEIFRGGAEKAKEAGVLLVGGHTVRDDEPKYGLVAVGLIDPQRVTRKGGASPGDVLLLTKPLGSGVITTALMRDLATADEVAAATASMMQLNRDAARLARRLGATAVTDVTGFGLAGHAAEMAERGGVALRFRFSALPWLEGAQRLAALDAFPGGARDNREHFGKSVRIAAEIEERLTLLAYSPETSGGLLIAAPRHACDELEILAAELGVEAVAVGEVVAGSGVDIVAG